MTWTEMRNDTDGVKNAVEKRLSEMFPTDEKGRFLSVAGVPFSICTMGAQPPWDFLVIEYHDTGEDGDGFYPEDYNSLDEMLKDMLEEVNQ